MSKIRDEERASLRERLKTMDRREKVNYIWGYYKVHFIIAALLLVTGAIVLRDMYTNQREQEYVHVGVIESCAMDTQIYLDYLAHIENWGEPLVYRPFVSATDASGDGMYQIAASLSAREMDIIICDASNLYFFLDSGVSTQLDQVIPLLGTKLEENLGGKDLCMIVMSGQERSEKAQAFADIILKYK